MAIKKADSTRVLKKLWNYVDQASYDQIVTKAFANIPVSLQLEFIRELLDDESNWLKDITQDAEEVKQIMGEAKKFLRKVGELV